MRILHVLDHSIPLQSGYTFRSRAIIQAQRALGWETIHLTGPKHNPGETPAASETVDGLEFHRCTADSFWAKVPIIGQLSVIHVLTKRLLELVARERPDVIHAHSPALNGVAAVRVGRKLGVPVVYEIRGFWEDAAVSHGTSKEGGLRYRLTRAMETWVLKRAEEITCICDGIRTDLLERGIAAEKITIVANAVDAARFQPVGERNPVIEQRYELQGHKVIAFIGSFYGYEGLDLLVAAFARLHEQRPDVRLLLVGGGQVADALSAQIVKLNLQDSVVMTGRVPYDEVQDYYSVTDILVYPRKSMRITELVTPLKPLEAMAQKSIFVASDVGGHKELVRDGVTGTLFKADDVDDLVRVLGRLLNNEASWPAIRDAGRAFVENERTWSNSVANLQSVYARLLKGVSI